MLIHAAGESAVGIAHNTYAVALSAENEKELLALEQRLRYYNVPHAAFRESDPPYNQELMAIGIYPVNDRRLIRRFLKRFSLIK